MRSLFSAAATLAATLLMTQNRPQYPPAPLGDVADVYHGVTVSDPYRWLEDADSPETIRWVDAQNALTRSMLAGPARERLLARLGELTNYPRTSIPVRRGGRTFFTHNTGLQNQGVLYVLDTPDAKPRVLFDPNALSKDGTVALTALAPSDDGTLIAYGISRSGSDRQEIFVREVATGRDRPDKIEWVKFASFAWVKDGRGFYYTRFPQPGSVPPGDEHYFSKVYFHRLGDPQSADRLIFEKPDTREAVLGVEMSDDGRWLVITAFQGASDKSEISVIDRSAPGDKPVPIFTGFAAAYTFIQDAGGRLLFQTDDKAPRGRIISVNPLRPADAPLEVVKESDDKLSISTIVHHTLVVSYLHNASDRVRLFDLTGKPAGEIALPAIGSLSGLSGRPEDTELFLGFSSFTYPPGSYRYDFATRALTGFRAGIAPPADAPKGAAIDPAQYETAQVRYPSKDGTRVSMFLVHRKDLPRDGQRPVLLSGYGGFNVNLTPAYEPSIFALLDKGGVYALANLRGGGEYGEAWHEAGMLERKQNVFDDFMAAAEWLAKSGFTTPKKIAIEGGSNGGLLTGAVLVQRPDLVGAVISRVPVADMLRYHQFTVGRFWIPEYGSADDPKHFPFLYRYSPYHNVKDGVAYPPTLIMTADTDDRVSPGMAKKFAARLQAADRHGAPVLIRVETKAGHGAGKPVSKIIEEDADILAFLFKYLKVE